MDFVHDAGKFLLGLAAILSLEACTENPATGQKQFTALMPTVQEAAIGADEHKKAIAQYGVYPDQRVQNYVREIGARLVPVTERKDVTYTFTVLDSPQINAFALPGGYVYVTRGLLAWANSEAELAAVIGHEIGHVNARHSAARYSTAIATSLGLNVLSAVVDVPLFDKAAGLGADLALSQYSQGQEFEADTLGIRYAQRVNYNPLAMSSFLQQLNRETMYEQRFKGQRSGAGLNQFFASHPSTPARVTRSAQEGNAAVSTVATPFNDNVIAYMRMIDGLPYGESDKEGYVQGQSFVHPALGFRFDAPAGYALKNGTNTVTATRGDGMTMIFDMASKQSSASIDDYLAVGWMKNAVSGLERITIGGLPAATAMTTGAINGQMKAVRLVAIEASPTKVYRFQYAVPQALANDPALQNELQASARSFRLLPERERLAASAQKIDLVAGKPGDTVDTLARRMNVFNTYEEARALFMALNAIDDDNAALTAGRLYKIVR